MIASRIVRAPARKGTPSMVQPSPIRVAVDAHSVGRRATGNETYMLGLVEALAGRRDIETVALLDARTVWPFEEPPEIRTCGTVPRARIPLELAVASRRTRADPPVQYVAPRSPACPWSRPSTTSRSRMCQALGRPTELPLAGSRSGRRPAAAVIAAISEFTRGGMIERYGVSPERIS